MNRRALLIAVATGSFVVPAAPGQDPVPTPAKGVPWKRHCIDDSSRGADGVRLGDFDGDGILDVVTGWEEGAEIRVYRNPGPGPALIEPWPRVTVGEVGSPEDALFVDLDADGRLDVVSCCEGETRCVFLHRSPDDLARWLEPASWSTTPVTALQGRKWMFAEVDDVDADGRPDLFLGAKGADACVGWLCLHAEDPERATGPFVNLQPAGWIMSLLAADIDGDGDRDLLVSDRRGERRGVYWLEHPAAAEVARPEAWTRHEIGGADHEVMFLDLADLDGDGHDDVVVPTRNGVTLWFRRLPPAEGSVPRWRSFEIENPYAVPWGKSVRVADIDGDGTQDLLLATNTSGDRTRRGICWLRARGAPTDNTWEAHELSGPQGVKFDLMEPLDLDGDGDLDVLACEERDGLGVFWYENPTH